MANLIKHQVNPDRYLKFDQFLIEFPQLSGFTKWVYAYIASRPPGWDIYAEEIAKHCTEGIGRVKKALKELQAVGLLLITLDQDEQTKRIKGRQWELFETCVNETLKAFKHQLASRKLKKAPEAGSSDEKPGLLRSSPSGSSSGKLDGSVPLPAAPATPPPPAPVQPAAREILPKQGEEKAKALNPVARRALALAEKAKTQILTPKQQSALDQRTAAEQRKAKLDAKAKTRRQEQFEKNYGAYAALPATELVDHLVKKFVPKSHPKQDRRHLESLRSWYARVGGSYLAQLVDAARLAGREKAYSAKFIITVLERNFQIQVPEV